MIRFIGKISTIFITNDELSVIFFERDLSEETKQFCELELLLGSEVEKAA